MADGSVSGIPLARAHGALRGVTMAKRKAVREPESAPRAESVEDIWLRSMACAGRAIRELERSPGFDPMRFIRQQLEKINQLSREDQEAFEWARRHPQIFAPVPAETGMTLEKYEAWLREQRSHAARRGWKTRRRGRPGGVAERRS